MVTFAARRSRERTSPVLISKFENMVPEIRHLAHNTFPAMEPAHFEAFASELVTATFDVFMKLAERGLSELVYPRPLVMAALARLKRGVAGPQSIRRSDRFWRQPR